MTEVVSSAVFLTAVRRYILCGREALIPRGSHSALRRRRIRGASYGVTAQTVPKPYAPPSCVVPQSSPLKSTGLLMEYKPPLPPVKTWSEV